jgi:hypothetical protein
MVDPPDDPNGLRIPFIFVPRGDPLPTQWIAEHPGYFTVPAVMVPRNADNSRRPWAEVQALLRETDAAWGTGAAPLASPPGGMAAPGIPGSFAPPPAREKRLRGGQPWPKDRNGGDWPADRWGCPTRPLWDYPPGVRAPGEGGSVSEAEAIASARVALAALDRAPRATLASDRTGGDTGGTQTPRRGVASRYPGAYDVAEAGQGEEDGRDDSFGNTTARAHVLAKPENYVNKTYKNAFGINCVAFAQSVAGAPLTDRWKDLGPVNAGTPRGTWVEHSLTATFRVTSASLIT